MASWVFQVVVPGWGMTVRDQHEDDIGEAGPPGEQPPVVEVRNTVVATSVSSAGQAHTVTGGVHHLTLLFRGSRCRGSCPPFPRGSSDAPPSLTN
ncbi:hypothetical protein ACVDFE_32835 [Lentzea chajnantorensis]